jgi:serpin B
MMTRPASADEKVNYARVGQTQIVELPYVGTLSMVIVLPDVLDGLGLIESHLRDGHPSWLQGFREETVDLELPRWTAEASLALERALANLGMPLAFQPGAADFSGIAKGKDLSIGNVVHRAFIDVNEKGTEAAAATGTVFNDTSIRSPARVFTFHADHPFLYLVRDRASGSILFMGRVVDPAAGGAKGREEGRSPG